MKQGIRRELLISALVITLVTLVFTGVLLVSLLVRNSNRRTAEYLVHRNTAITFFIRGYFTEISNTLSVLAGDPRVTDAAAVGAETHPAVLERFRAFMQANSNILFLYSGYEDRLMLINDWEPPEDFDHRTRPWYLAAMERPGTVVVTEPFLEAATGEWIISPSRTLQDSAGTLAGVVAIDSSISHIAALLAEAGGYVSSTSFVLDTRGRVIIHHDETLLGEPHALQDGASLEEVLRGNSRETDGTGGAPGGGGVFADYRHEEGPRRGYMTFLPDLQWIVVTEVDLARATRELRRTVFLYLVLLAGMLVMLGSVQSSVLGRRLATPILEITPVLERAAQGDFTGIVEPRGSNEITSMGMSTSRMVEQCVVIIRHVLKSVERLTTETATLQGAADQAATVAEEQSAAVTELIAATEEVGELAHRVELNVAGIARKTTDTAEIVTRGSRGVVDVLHQMEEISRANDRTLEGVGHLDAEIASIAEMVQIINGITEQTRIIAFSAELEASSARTAASGAMETASERGRQNAATGENFHIVAAEIRRLADSTGQSTAEIRARLENVQTASTALREISRAGTATVEKGARLAQGLHQDFEAVLGVSRESAGAAADIATLVEQQNTAFRQIIATLHQLAQGIDRAVEATGESRQVSRELQNLAEELHQHMRQYRLPR